MSEIDSSMCECERWRDGITQCPVHPDSRAPESDEDAADVVGVVDVGDLITQLQILASENAAKDGPPTPFLAGTFAVYPTTAGGGVIVFETGGQVKRITVKPAMLRAFSAMAKGGPGGLFKGIFRR